jgi:Rrf2 family protein
MKLTRSVSYAVGVLLRIDELAGRGQVTAARVARGCRFPPRFLYRVLRRLVASGVLEGTSGPGGGYRLARPAARLSLLDIVESVEGAPKGSVLEPVRADQRRAIERINRLCQADARRFARELAAIKLADLRGKASTGRRKKKRAAKRKP